MGRVNEVCELPENSELYGVSFGLVIAGETTRAQKTTGPLGGDDVHILYSIPAGAHACGTGYRTPPSWVLHVSRSPVLIKPKQKPLSPPLHFSGIRRCQQGQGSCLHCTWSPYRSTTTLLVVRPIVTQPETPTYSTTHPQPQYPRAPYRYRGAPYTIKASFTALLLALS